MACPHPPDASPRHRRPLTSLSDDQVHIQAAPLRRGTERRTRSHVRQLEALGYKVTLAAAASPNTVQLRLHRCSLGGMPRAGWMKPESDRRLSDLVSVGVLTRVFPPGLVDEVIAEAGRTEQRHRSSAGAGDGVLRDRDGAVLRGLL